MSQLADSAPTPGSSAAPRLRVARAGGRVVPTLGFLLLMGVLLAADLGLKHWAFRHVADRPVVLTAEAARDHRGFWLRYAHEPVVVLPEVLNLQLTTNTGAVFGLGKGNRVLFISISALATAVIGWMFWRSPAGAWLLHVALAMILAGALGNLYDRVLYSAVRDMLHLFPGVPLPLGLAWPGGVRDVWPWIFNLADVALLAGVGLVLIVTWRTEARAKAQAAESAPPPPATPSS